MLYFCLVKVATKISKSRDLGGVALKSAMMNCRYVGAVSSVTNSRDKRECGADKEKTYIELRECCRRNLVGAKQGCVSPRSQSCKATTVSAVHVGRVDYSCSGEAAAP